MWVVLVLLSTLSQNDGGSRMYTLKNLHFNEIYEVPERANRRRYRMDISDGNGYGGTGADGDGDTGGPFKIENGYSQLTLL